MSIHESGEMYLETIYILSQHGEPVRSIDVAEHMGYSKPSVSRGVGLLKKRGLVSTDKSGALVLTSTGMQRAEKIYERHTLLTKFLVKLGVDKETAATDACKIEHVISDKSFDAIKMYIEEGTE